MSHSTAIPGQFSSGTKLTLCPQPKELFIITRDGVADEIIKQGLSRTQTKLYFYFSKLDRFGDRPAKIDAASVSAETGVCKSAYYAAIAFFKKKGWFDFTDAETKVSNNSTQTRKSTNMESDSTNMESDSTNMESDSTNMESDSTNMESEKLKVLPAKDSATPQTIQTYSNLLQTLPEGQRESFEKFCKKKIEELPFKIGIKKSWFNKHGAEYLEEFKEMYSIALANPQIMAPKVQPCDLVDIPSLKRMYGDGWKEVAIHFGLISPNSPAVEIKQDTFEAEPHDTVDW